MEPKRFTVMSIPDDVLPLWFVYDLIACKSYQCDDFDTAKEVCGMANRTGEIC